MNDINITLGTGGLARDVLNTDVISGLAFYNNLETQTEFDTANITDITATDRVKAYTSLDEFELLTGINFNNSLTEEIWYQVKEFFRLAGNVKLYVGLFYDTNLAGTPVALTYTELQTMQVFADGEIKQIGIVATGVTLSDAEIIKVQGISDTLYTLHTPTFFLYGADTSSIALTSLTNLRAMATPSKDVSVVILQDGDNYGATLATTSGNSIPAIGATLGAVSLSSVNESIAWVQKFNITGNGELDAPAFGDGTLVKDTITATINQLNNYGYIFGIKHVGISGTYFNENSTCDALTSDYAYMGEVRTIAKAVRKTRTSMLPYLNSPLKVDPKTGYLSNLTITTWSNVMGTSLNVMAQDAEISGYSVYINPKQNVLSTSKVEAEIKLVPYGTAREISIVIGFSASL